MSFHEKKGKFYLDLENINVESSMEENSDDN